MILKGQESHAAEKLFSASLIKKIEISEIWMLPFRISLIEKKNVKRATNKEAEPVSLGFFVEATLRLGRKIPLGRVFGSSCSIELPQLFTEREHAF